VVEIDQLETGEHRGGMYYGVWGFASKLTAAIGIGVASLVLQISGYTPNVAQTTETLFAIRLFFGPVSLVILAIALPLLVRYPITRKSHAEVLAKLDAMEEKDREEQE
jgi:GPH family glycoside/pentoside/hexuronide:cation symporter